MTRIRPTGTHKGCVYMIVKVCRNRRCRPAELCIRGRQVYRSIYGGHHHADDLQDRKDADE